MRCGTTRCSPDSTDSGFPLADTPGNKRLGAAARQRSAWAALIASDDPQPVIPGKLFDTEQHRLRRQSNDDRRRCRVPEGIQMLQPDARDVSIEVNDCDTTLPAAPAESSRFREATIEYCQLRVQGIGRQLEGWRNDHRGARHDKSSSTQHVPPLVCPGFFTALSLEPPNQRKYSTMTFGRKICGSLLPGQA